MRAHTLVLALALTASPAAVLLPAATAHAAPTPSIKASITCDPATDTVTARLVSDRYLPAGVPVTVDFTSSGGYAETSSGYTQLLPTTKTVAVTADASGSLDLAGYTRGAPLHGAVFYTETVRAVVWSAAGARLADTSATCGFDTRTTVALACDPVARTVTATAGGVNFDRYPRVSVRYTETITSQQNAANPGFVSYQPTTTHQAVASRGAWSDVMYTRTVQTPEPYYYADKVDVEIWATHDFGMFVASVIVGRGSASCVYSDHRTG